MPVDVTMERFEELVGDALDGLPPEIAAMLDNVVIIVDDGHIPGLLGLYQGTPHTARAQYGYMNMPDQITIFRKALCQRAWTETDLVRDVRVTVVHELGHHMGLDDARLHELGYG